MSFSDYIVYVDESGDHGMARIDPDYPVFALAFCVFKKTDYVSKVVPALQTLKFRYWGHDAVIFHERDFRKGMKGEYDILSDVKTRESFMRDLNEIITDMPFHAITAVVHKALVRFDPEEPVHPYHLGLEFCLEQLAYFLEGQGTDVVTTTTHLVFESRGTREDEALELEFYRIKEKLNVQKSSFRMRFVSKKANCSGLQLADLLARPVGLHVLRPDQINRAFEIIQPKLFTKNGNHLGYGLKIYP